MKCTAVAEDKGACRRRGERPKAGTGISKDLPVADNRLVRSLPSPSTIRDFRRLPLYQPSSAVRRQRISAA